MINTICKTVGAQENTQDIKQSPSMKIGTKPYARSRRNELTEVTGRWTRHWKKVTGRSDQEARQQARPNAGSDAGGRSTGRRTAESGRVQKGSRVAKMRPDAFASDQWIAAPTVGTTGRVRSVRDQRPVSSRKAGFHPQRLLS